MAYVKEHMEGVRASGLRLLTSNVGGPPCWQEACREYVETLELQRYSDRTLEWYRFLLQPFGRYLELQGITDPSEVGEQHVRAFLRLVSTEGFEGRIPVGARRQNHYREGLYRFYVWLNGQGYVEHNPAARIGKAKEPKRLIPTFTETQIAAILQQPDRTSFVGLRDYCFLLTLLDTGLRLSEALSLKVSDLDLEELQIDVIGKGDKQRRAAMSPRLVVELKPYLRKRESAVAIVGAPDSPWVFPNDVGGRLCSKAMQKRVREYGVLADISRVRVSPHTFRHTFAVNFVRNGGDPFTLQKILGHESLETTRRYCELAEEDVLRRHRELTPLKTMDLKLPGSKRIPRGSMRDW
jgi:integrase/recombinase XerD